jgi:hypothetical protein
VVTPPPTRFTPNVLIVVGFGIDVYQVFKSQHILSSSLDEQLLRDTAAAAAISALLGFVMGVSSCRLAVSGAFDAAILNCIGAVLLAAIEESTGNWRAKKTISNAIYLKNLH